MIGSPNTAPEGTNASLSPVVGSALESAGLGDIRDRVLAGERLTEEEGVRLISSHELAGIGGLANWVRESRHGDLTYFNRNLHINATNVCEATCIFCSFSRLKTGDPNAYTMSLDQAVGKVRALKDTFVTEVHIVNGLNPDLPFSYYTDLLTAIKVERPDLHVKGFTAVEIHYYAGKYGMTYTEVLQALREAGLDSLPGGGAEIFAARARRKLCHDKVGTQDWLEVHRVAHKMGMRSNCTMLYGSIERLDERIDHLVHLRALQDETGGFQTFIPLKFHNENNRLKRIEEPTDQDTLRTLAVSRLMLDNIPHIKSYWPMLGVQTAQVSQSFGSDDLDGTVREERIYHMAGAKTPQQLTRGELIALIRRAGRIPVERDTLYRVVAEA
jgi:aminodeoxyfutalosine synthase